MDRSDVPVPFLRLLSHWPWKKFNVKEVWILEERFRGEVDLEKSIFGRKDLIWKKIFLEDVDKTCSGDWCCEDWCSGLAMTSLHHSLSLGH